MNRNLRTNIRGFTIIEVVLVLAIAALIFLLVFLAVPALQRNQRDTQRKSDVGRFLAQIQNYQSANKGNIPDATAAAMTTASTGFVDKYMKVGGDTWEDPNGGDYTFVYGAGAGPTVEKQIRYAKGGRCGTDGAITASTNTRQAAASINLEGGSAYCQQN